MVYTVTVHEITGVITMDFRRQYDIINPDAIDQPRIHIVGCGGIGSFVGYYLAQMGLTRLTLWDADSVEEHNLPNQNFLKKHVGMNKAKAMKDMIGEKGIDTTNIKLKKTFFTNSSKFVAEEGDTKVFVIVATDNMATRRDVADACVKDRNVERLFDGRLGGLMFQMFNINSPYANFYNDYFKYQLFDDSEAEQLPCTERAVIFVGAMIGSMMAHQVYLSLKEPESTRESVLVDLYTGCYQSGETGFTFGFLR